MIITIVTIITFSFTASILLLASLMLSSQLSQREQLVEATIIVEQSQPNAAFPCSLED